MIRKLTGLSRRYVAALRKYLKQGRRASLQPARRLGRQAMTYGLETLDLARIHEQILVTELLPSYSISKRSALMEEAEVFYTVAIIPIEKRHFSARQPTGHLTILHTT